MKKFSYIVILIISLLVSCQTYNDKLLGYHASLANKKYVVAEQTIKQLKFLKHRRNELLKCLELGRVYQLQQQYDSSNVYFNRADALFDERHTLRNISTSVLVNSAMSVYQGEDFEKVMVNYYKALNYLALKKNEDALVEAKRINIRLNDLSDKTLFEGKRYKADAFGQVLQGLVYERMGDFNNAFIAYRNAEKLFENNTTSYMGTALPYQLKIDLINTADKSSLYGERDEYCKKYNLVLDSIKKRGANELVLIWENGLVPAKQEKDISLFLVKGVGGEFVFQDKNGQMAIPFPWPSNESDKAKIKLSDFQVVRIALPEYRDNLPLIIENKFIVNHKNFMSEPIENLTYIAHETLKERFLKEATVAVSRLVIKKVAEYNVTKENDALGSAIGILGAAIEKADTRNWQSLPSVISYIRVPVNAGNNKIGVDLKTVDGRIIKDTINYQSTSKLDILNYSTLSHL